MASTNKAFFVGIDLGTSRSAVSSANGERHVVDSYVGWPVDHIARKLLKKQVLIGREAIDNRSMLDLRRPLEAGYLKEGSEKDEAAVRELLRYLISLSGIEDEDKKRPKIHAVVGVPARALVGKQLHLRNAMKGILDSVMIVPEPFAVAYGLEELLHTMVIDIGAGTTDFCLMNGRYPSEEERRTLTEAGDTVDQELARLVRERYPEVQFSIHMIREWKEKWGFVGEPEEAVIVTAPVGAMPAQFDITHEMRSACEILLPPLIDTMFDLLAHVEPDYQERVRHNIILAGGCSQIYGLRESLQHALSRVGGGQVRVVKDPIFAGADGGLAIALDAADSDWETLAA
jgi:rod shape-determining protein MreB